MEKKKNLGIICRTDDEGNRSITILPQNKNSIIKYNLENAFE